MKPLSLLFAIAVLACLFAVQARAQDTVAQPQAANPKFELLDGDRVVLLGGTLIEREQNYGWWELMLTCAYPDRHIVFRNLGWSGDTVWGESRAGFDPPAKGYEKLLAQMAAVKPTVIILGYGNVEAHAGPSDLPRFIAQYEKLLGDLKKHSAGGVRFLIISPMLMEKMAPPLPDPAEYNAKVVEYRKGIEAMAEKRASPYIRSRIDADTWREILGFKDATEINNNVKIQVSDDSAAYSEHGFKIYGTHLLTQLSHGYGLNHFSNQMVMQTINANGELGGGAGFAEKQSKDSDRGVSFKSVLEALNWEPPILLFRGLSKGMYEAHVDGKSVKVKLVKSDQILATAEMSSFDNNAFTVIDDPNLQQHDDLRNAIIRKNFLYFNAYRPQNDTYLFGFRKKEQGNNAGEVQELLKLVEELDREITKLKKPQPHTYELIRIGDAKAEEKK